MTESKSKQPITNGKARTKPGPKPQYLKINGDWQDAVKLAMQKKKPANGWPK